MKYLSAFVVIVMLGTSFLPTNAAAQGLTFGWEIYETSNYWIVITETCRQGDPECDATYTGTNKQSGASVQIKGKVAMLSCQDASDTPCAKEGYDFIKGDTDYFLHTLNDANLYVSVKGKQVLSEAAKLITQGDGLFGPDCPSGPSNK